MGDWRAVKLVLVFWLDLVLYVTALVGIWDRRPYAAAALIPVFFLTVALEDAVKAARCATPR